MELNEAEEELLMLMIMDKDKKLVDRELNSGKQIDDMFEFAEAKKKYQDRNERLRSQLAIAIDGDFMCNRCKSNKHVTYRQMQTRRGDEAMTTKIYCKNCRITWQE